MSWLKADGCKKKDRQESDKIVRQNHTIKGRFAKGNNANPNGRPKGSRDKINKLRDMLLDQVLDEDNPEILVNIIKTIKTEHPAIFVNLLGKLIPNRLEISGDEDNKAPIIITDTKAK